MPKPPSTTTYAYRVRIDGLMDDKVDQFFKQYCQRWLLVHHETTTENPHYHAYCETKYSQGNFSNHIKRDLGVKGGDYSNKKCDSDRMIEYLSYLFNSKKGNKSRVVSYEGFSVLDVATYKANAEQIAEEFQQRMSATKKTQYDIVMIVLERMDPRQTCYPAIVYDVVIDTLKAYHMVARPNHIKDIISCVMAYSDDKDARDRSKELTLKYFQSINT